MRFAALHPLLCLVVAAFVPLIFWFRSRLERLNASFLSLTARNGAGFAGLSLLALFYVAFYLLRPVYYTPYFGGTLGDNFNYVLQGVTDPTYINPQHFFFPFIAGRGLRLTGLLGAMPGGDPGFLMRAFALFSLPMRFFAAVGLFFSYLTFRRLKMSTVEAFLGAFFVAASFGYWIWALQSNAMGFLIAFIPVCLYAHVSAFEDDRPLCYALAAAATCACMFIHISSIYFCLSQALLTAAIGGRRAIVRKSVRPLVNVAIYAGVAAVLGAAFYVWAAKVVKTYDVGLLMQRLSDYNMFGEFGGAGFFKNLLSDGISTNLSLLVGFVQSGDRPPLELAVIGAVLTLFFTLLASIDWKGVLTGKTWDRNLFFIAGSFVIVIVGFSVRKTWPQYYAAVTSLSAILFVALVFRAGAPQRSGFRHVFLAGLTALMIGLNGLGSTPAVAGGDVEEGFAYRTIKAIRVVQPTGPVVYVGQTRTYPYNFISMLNYFQTHPTYREIQWPENLSPEDAWADLAKGATVIVNRDDFPQAVAPSPAVTREAIVPDRDKPFRFLVVNPK